MISLRHIYIESGPWSHCLRPICRRDLIRSTPSLTTHGPIRQQYRDYITFGTLWDCWWTRQHRWEKMNVNAPKRGGQITPFPWIVAKRITINIIEYMCILEPFVHTKMIELILGYINMKYESLMESLILKWILDYMIYHPHWKCQAESSTAYLWPWSKVAFTAWKFVFIPLAMWNWNVDIFRVYGFQILNKN